MRRILSVVLCLCCLILCGCQSSQSDLGLTENNNQKFYDAVGATMDWFAGENPTLYGMLPDWCWDYVQDYQGESKSVIKEKANEWLAESIYYNYLNLTYRIEDEEKLEKVDLGWINDYLEEQLDCTQRATVGYKMDVVLTVTYEGETQSTALPGAILKYDGEWYWFIYDEYNYEIVPAPLALCPEFV